ncbi:MAG: ribonuclease III [Lachnospiraceae bacterium]|nr:ribonuclease III [Lachnospiraceae bacterium]MDE6698924.1 ribonuclease III [Lachnospiraceae bacterium]
MHSLDISVLESKIGYTFTEKDLIKRAVTHSSYSNDRKMGKLKNNERLEFLGDAVLELCTSDFLYKEYSEKPEGELTRLRASIVCEPTLAECARGIDLPDYLILGKGEENTGGRYRDSIVSDAFEAVIGAIYLDGGLDMAKSFITRFVLSDIENKHLFYDSKTILQEMMQKDYKETVSYELLSESGPDHNKEFKVAVLLEEKVLGTGIGRTKRKAEQQAAYEAILKIRNAK